MIQFSSSVFIFTIGFKTIVNIGIFRFFPNTVFLLSSFIVVKRITFLIVLTKKLLLVIAYPLRFTT